MRHDIDPRTKLADILGPVDAKRRHSYPVMAARKITFTHASRNRSTNHAKSDMLDGQAA